MSDDPRYSAEVCRRVRELPGAAPLADGGRIARGSAGDVEQGARVEFEFQDGTTRNPSPQSFSYFPAARGFFRYSCPCHSCSGEFDLSPYIAELADKAGRKQRARSINVTCTGLRAHQPFAPSECPICARITLSATLHSPE